MRIFNMGQMETSGTLEVLRNNLLTFYTLFHSGIKKDNHALFKDVILFYL